MTPRHVLPPPPTPAQLFAGGAIPRRVRGRATWRLLAGVLVALLVALLVLLLVAVIVSTTGIVAFLVGTTLATIPAVVVMGAFLWVDRWEPEPRVLLIGLFAWGAVVAALISGLVNTLGMSAIARIQGPAEAEAVTAVFVAPVVEEVTKALGVVLVLLVRRREFDGVVDGVVCAGVTALGFAFSENILYFGRAFLQGEQAQEGAGLLAAGTVFFLRGILSPFAHPLFTIATGLGIGIAATTTRPALRFLAPIAGLIVAIVLHGTWNLSGVAGLPGFLATYVGFMVPVFLLVIALIVWLRTREGRVIARHLPVYAEAGWIPPYDVTMVATMAGRRKAREWARAWLGERGERTMRQYQTTATELAFLRDRASRAHVPDFRAREHALLMELARDRSAFAGAGPLLG